MPLTFNGRSPASLSLAVVSVSDWLDGPTVQRSATDLPDVLGVAPAAVVTGATREIQIGVRIKAPTLAGREALLAAYYDATTGQIPLVWDDHPTRAVRVVATNRTVRGVAERVAHIVPALIVTTTFVAYDPVAYDIEPRVIGLSATPAPIEVGTLPAPGVVFLTGALSALATRTLTYRSFNGISYGSLSITPPSGESLGANDVLEVNLLRRTLIKLSGGVRTSVYHWKSGGRWFAPQNADCDRPRSQWPTLAVDSGAGSYVYRPAWAL